MRQPIVRNLLPSLRLHAPLGLALTAGLAVAGCSVNPGPAFEDVRQTVSARTGGQRVQWLRGGPEDAEVDAAVHALLRNQLNADAAVQIALLNNRTLQAQFEEIGISQADLVQAGLLKNPSFTSLIRFPNQPPSATDAEFSVTQDLLDVLVLPLRKRIAAQQLEQTKLRVADEALKLSAETKSAFYTLQARQQLLGRLKLIVETNDAAADIAKRQREAGNINNLTLADEQATYSQSRLDAALTEAQTHTDREALNRLMGLYGADTNWKVGDRLPDLPRREVPLDHLESLAIAQRLDLNAAQMQLAVVARSLGLSNFTRYFPAISLGVDTERTPDRQRVTGPQLSLEIPIFDQGQAQIAKFRAIYRQAQRNLEAQATNIRAEVREARDRVVANRDAAEYVEKVLLPQRILVVNQTQLQVNAMQESIFTLLLAKQNEVGTERTYADVGRDYWIARADLERAVGGRLNGRMPAPGVATDHKENVRHPRR